MAARDLPVFRPAELLEALPAPRDLDELERALEAVEDARLARDGAVDGEDVDALTQALRQALDFDALRAAHAKAKAR